MLGICVDVACRAAGILHECLRSGHFTCKSIATSRCAGQQLAGYSVLQRWLLLLQEPLPRNAMGKVNKKELRAQFFPGK
jgi:hypothetical protein